MSFAKRSDSFLVLLDHVLECDVLLLQLLNRSSGCILDSSQRCHSFLELDVVLSVPFALYLDVVEFTDFVVECKSKGFNLVAVIKLFSFCLSQLLTCLAQSIVFFFIFLL